MSPQALPEATRGLIRRVLPACVLAALLAVAAVALRDRVRAVGGALPGPGALSLAVGANLAGNLLLVDAWRKLVAATGAALGLGEAARVWTLSQLARYALGAAQVPGRALAGRRHGVGATAGAVTTLAEVAWSLSLTAVVVLATAPAWLPGAGGLRWLTVTAVLPAGVVTALLVAPGQVLAALGRLAGTGLLARLTRGRLAQGIGQLHLDRRQAAALTVRYALVVATRVAAVLVLFGALGGSVPREGARAAGGWALGQVVGQLAVFAPGGLGPREGATALVVGPALGAGGALALVALLRLTEIVAELACLALAQALPGRR